MPGMNLKVNPNVKLPLAFIMCGLVAFAASQIILLFHTELLLLGSFRVPPIWMATHFLLLGFAVLIAMGAMYQLVPVAFLAQIWNQTFGIIQFLVTIIGIGSLTVLLGIAPEKAVYGGIIAVVGILMFILQMLLTILKQKSKNIMTIFVISAIVFFLFTIIAGFLLAWNLSFGNLPMHQPILYSHLAFGITGWFSLLIFGFSYKLVPMFSLSHGFSMKGAKPAFITYTVGQLILIVSFWLPISFVQTVAWILLFIGFLFFVLDIRDILKKRLRRKLDKPFSFSIVAIFIGFAIHFIAVIFHIIGLHDPTLWSWLIFLYVIGWIIFSILGYLYKIVPFLWWTHKYSDRIGKEKVPTMGDMVNEKLSVILFSLFIISIVGLLGGVLLQIGILTFIFQAILTVTSVIYVFSIVKVLFI